MTEEIEIPFGAFDSETIGWTYTIPEGFTAKIEDGKIIVEKENESKDKQIIDALTKRIQDMYDNETAIYEGVQVSDILAWLKKQKEQKINHKGLYKGSLRHVDNPTKWMEEDDMEKEQKPAEWSEEDEEIYNSFKTICEILIKNPHEEKFEADTVYAEKMLSWLKSLRPQPHWKPSDEQMKMLNEAIEHYSKYWDSENIKSLCSLYDDLKKLM